MERIFDYFPELTPRQKEQYAALLPIYEEWNAKINVISRKDMVLFYLHHVLHSLSIAKLQPFKPMSDILDLGTGGGFPGIPLAIMFPEARFHLVDSVGKKIKVVQAVIDAVGLENCRAEQIRAEQLRTKYDFVVTRAVAALPQLLPWLRGKISPLKYHKLDNGLICLKGGDLADETKGLSHKVHVYPVSAYFSEDYFATKSILHIPLH